MKLMFIATFLTISITYASECIDINFETSNKVTQLQDFVDELSEKIEWFAANDKDVDRAKCVDQEDFSDEAIARHLSSFGDETVTQSIQGVTITDHPRKIELLKKLLRTSFFLPQVNLNEASKNCKDVSCVTRELFQDQANNYLYLLDKYGLNLNDKRINNTAKWNDDEVKHIMKSINYIPKQLLPFESNQTIVRGSRNSTGGSTYANATMYFFDAHFDQTPQMQTYTLFHEVGHNIASDLDLDVAKEWTNLSEWKPEYKKDSKGKVKISYDGKPEISSWHHGHDHSLPSDYAKTNPKEDFAETFSAYRFNPKKLKEISPNKYEYMKKNIFQGVEFLSEESCKKENSLPYKLFNIKDAQMPSTIEDLSVCKETIPAIINKEQWKNQTIECAKKLKAQVAIKKQLDKQQPPLSKLQRDSILNSSLLPIEDITVSEQEFINTQKLLTEEIMDSMVKKFNIYSSCDEQKKYLVQNLEHVDNKISEFQYIDHFEKDLNESLYKICKEYRATKDFSCEDDLWMLSEEEKQHKKNLCPTGEKKLISCDDSLSKYKTTNEKLAFQTICKSSNLEKPKEMRCSPRTKRMFAELAGINLSNLSSTSETKSFEKCSF